VERVKIILKSGKEQSVRRYHPWIFSGAIKKIVGDPVEGDVVEVFDNKNVFLATGHYQPASIAVRILSFENIIPDEKFFTDMIKSAIDLRRKLGLLDNKLTNVYRLINAEGDNLPGLIADYYDGVVVIQMHSVGMYRIRSAIVKILSEVFDNNLTAIYDKSEATLPFMSGIKAQNEFLLGKSDPVVVKEEGMNLK
jgi:23S rRNA (cytosine1962-C5)-methyltransferase